jgi:O-antigen ligase
LLKNFLSFPSRAAKSGFWLYALHLWSVFGIALSNIFFGLTALVAPRAVRGTSFQWRRVKPVLVPLALYAAFVLASIPFSYDPLWSLSAGRHLLSLASLFLALVLVRGELQVRQVIDGLVIVTALVATYGLAQFLVGFGDISHRIRGPFSHYMTFAGVLLMVDLLLIAQMLCGSAWRSRWRWVALVVINVALVGSLTRSAWVGLVLTMIVMLLLRSPRYLLGMIPAALLFLILSPTPVIERVLSIGDVHDISNYDRLCMAEAGLHMIAERPLFGIGPGMVEKLYPIYRHPTGYRPTTPHLHNSYLEIAAESGLPALGAYLWMIGGTLWLSYRRYRLVERRGGSNADLYMGTFVALLAFSLAGIFEDNWGDTEVQRVALFVIAIPYCLSGGGWIRSSADEESVDEV